MKKKKFKYFPNGWYIGPIILIPIGLIFIIWGAILYGIKGNEIILAGASIFITLGLGSLSLGFAFLSIGIAKESDKKMEANANESILKICDTFGDKRILYLNQIRKENLSKTEYMAWKCETDMDRAFDLMETSEIKLENIIKMYNVFFELLRQFPWQGKVIDDVLIKDNVVIIGDSLTDLPMAKIAGFFIAFNAKEELKEKTDVVVEKKDLREVLKYIFKD